MMLLVAAGDGRIGAGVMMRGEREGMVRRLVATKITAIHRCLLS